MPVPYSSALASLNVWLLSLLPDSGYLGASSLDGVLVSDSVESLCHNSFTADDVIVLIARQLDNDLLGKLESIQQVASCAALLVALKAEQAEQAEQDYIWLLKTDVQEIILAKDISTPHWQQSILLAHARKRHESQLKRFSRYDSLTQLPNRTLFYERLEHGLVQGQRKQQDMGVVFLDLDRFRVVNDVYGHQVGDNLLKACAKRMQMAVRRSDTLARLGSNNFAVILDDVSGNSVLEGIADKLRLCFNEPYNICGNEIFVSISLGMQLASQAGYDAGELVRHAELALHQAKSNGPNTSQLYQHQELPGDKARMTLESSLHHALEREQLHLVYQPQVDINQQSFTGVETLLRWTHPLLGNVPPSVFIPILEDTGLIERFGEWVLRSACEQFRIWLQQGVVSPSAKLSVNLSPRQFRRHDLGEQIRKTLCDTCLPPGSLTLEVTEGMLMANLDQGIELLAEMRRLGVSVAVDDFGTGYSSLSYLKDLPIDYLKIDRVFVKDIVTDGNDAAIANSIIVLAHNLGLKVVAEGVESKETLNILEGFGCDQYQGYLFSKPVLADDIPVLANHCSGEQPGQCQL